MFRPRRALLGRLLIATAFAVVIGAGITPLARPTTVSASTTIGRTAESDLLAMINNARVSNGLVRLQLDTRVRDLAEYRAGVMAAKDTMSHTIAGCLSCELTSRGIQWYTEGEAIAWDSYSYPDEAIRIIFQLWHDASHWPLLMSTKFNYVGLGVVYRSDNNKTWASLVLTESVDHTRPWAKNGTSSRSGSSVTWTWSGGDYRLQTHTAGFKNYDVAYRVDSGSWVLLKSGITSTSLTLSSRLSGHSYSLMVRSRDWRGNLSWWTPEVKVSVP